MWSNLVRNLRSSKAWTRQASRLKRRLSQALGLLLLLRRLLLRRLLLRLLRLLLVVVGATL